LHYVHNYVGAQEFHVESNEPVPEGKAKLRYEFEPTGKPDIAKGKGSVGRAQLYMNDKLVGQTELPVTVSLLLAGCGKSRDFGKTVMKRARNGNLGLIKSTGYEGAKGDELGWKHHRPTFSAAC